MNRKTNYIIDQIIKQMKYKHSLALFLFLGFFVTVQDVRAQKELSRFQDETGKWGYKDDNNKIMIKPIYEAAQYFEKGLAIVKKGGKYGVINAKGKTIVRIKYDQINILNYRKVICLVTNKGKAGVIKQNKMVIPLRYDTVVPIKVNYIPSDTYFKVGKLDQNNITFTYALFKDGKNLTNFTFKHLDHWLRSRPGLLKASKDGRRFGFISLDSGKEKLPFKYSKVSAFDEEQKAVVNDDYYIDAEGKQTGKHDNSFLIYVMGPDSKNATPYKGLTACYKFISKNLKYPKKAIEMGVEGRVVIEFIVERDGSLSDLKITRRIGGGCDEEVLRLFKMMPRWIPAKNNNKLVRQKKIMPVMFKLQ